MAQHAHMTHLWSSLGLPLLWWAGEALLFIPLPCVDWAAIPPLPHATRLSSYNIVLEHILTA